MKPCDFLLIEKYIMALFNNCFTETVQHLSSADLAVLEKMKSTIDNQRDAIRSKNSEIESVKNDLEAVCECSV